MRALTVLSICAAVLMLAGCAPDAGSGPPAVPSVPPDGAGVTGVVQTAPAATTTGAQGDATGLVAAEFPVCDVGAQILRYLKTGDNGGDPTLDQLFAQHVGTTAPQARALADDYITRCNAQWVARDAAASSSAAQVQQAATITARRQRACAAINGKVTEANCASTVVGNPSGQQGGDCSDAYVWFTEDGSLDANDLQREKEAFPGCFR